MISFGEKCEKKKWRKMFPILHGRYWKGMVLFWAREKSEMA